MIRAPLTRRALARAAGAALGVVALPAGTSAPAAAGTPSAAAAAGQGPDAGLFDLLAQLDEARRIENAADAVFEDAHAVYFPVWNDKPATLWERGSDRCCGFGRASGAPPDDEGGSRAFYSAHDVERIRAVLADAVQDPPDSRGSVPVPLTERGKARCREIVAAHEVWAAAVERADASTGYRAAAVRCDEAVSAMLDIEERIHDTPARTVAGLAAKAAVELVGAERADIEPTVLDFLREVAAFAQVGA